MCGDAGVREESAVCGEAGEQCVLWVSSRDRVLWGVAAHRAVVKSGAR